MNGNSDFTLVPWDEFKHQLAVTQSLDAVKDILDKTAALQVYARESRQSLDTQNKIAEYRLWTQRRAGELLAQQPKNPGAATPSMTTRALPPKLADLGITHDESSQWQRIAAIPEPVLQQHVADTKAARKELTTVGALRLAKELRQEPVTTPALPNGKYRCIVIDPPWPMVRIAREERPLQPVSLDYPTMTVEEIARMPIGALADEGGCHLYLWVTHRFLPDGLRLVEGWGFRYQCLMTWVKPTGMTPYSWMYNTEHVIFARMGSLPLERMGLKLSIEASVIRHSEKPDAFYERVALASPAPRIDLFARRERDGFAVWGNEVNRDCDS